MRALVRLSRFARAHHLMVHVLLLGTVLASLTSSTTIVFLPVYLMHTLHTNPITIGWIVGAGAITATAGGFIGGTLSDLIGRKLLLLLSLATLSLVFLGFAITTNLLCIVFLNVIRGLSTSFFSAVSKALLADLTPKENRLRVFSNQYLVGNIGYCIGPAIGTCFGLAGNMWAFLLAAFIYVLYLIFMVVMSQIYRVQSRDEQNIEKFNISQAWSVFRKDRVLFLFIVGSALLTSVHGEMSVTLSQYLMMTTSDGGNLFGILMSINAITVLATQVFISRWSERFGLFRSIALGSTLFALGEIGFSLSTGWVGWIASMVIFTFGEILIIPSENAQIDEITPAGMRGMYYGAQGFNAIGNAIGPWFGGFLLISCGGKIMFLTMALLSLVGFAFYAFGRQHKSYRTDAIRGTG